MVCSFAVETLGAKTAVEGKDVQGDRLFVTGDDVRVRTGVPPAKGEGDLGGGVGPGGSANVQRWWLTGPTPNTLGPWDNGLRRCLAKT